MHWQIDCPAQVVASVEMAVRSVLGRCELEEVAPRRSGSIRRRDRATRSGRNSFPSSRRDERLVGAAASGGGARSGRHRRTGRASHPADARCGKRSRRRGHRAVDRRVPGLDDHRCAPLPRDGRYAAIEPGTGALDRSIDRHVQRDHRPRSVRREAGGWRRRCCGSSSAQPTRCAPDRSRSYGPSAKARSPDRPRCRRTPSFSARCGRCPTGALTRWRSIANDRCPVRAASQRRRRESRLRMPAAVRSCCRPTLSLAISRSSARPVRARPRSCSTSCSAAPELESG